MRIGITARIYPNQFAELIGISERKLSDIIVAKEKPTFEILQKICENINVTLDYLVFGRE